MKMKANSQAADHSNLPLKIWPNPGRRNDKIAVVNVLKLKYIVTPVVVSVVFRLLRA